MNIMVFSDSINRKLYRNQIKSTHVRLVFEKRGKPEYPEENLSEQSREPNKTQPTYDAESGNRIRATVVGGECSHAPLRKGSFTPSKE